jgi:hypothetical protein
LPAQIQKLKIVLKTKIEVYIYMKQFRKEKGKKHDTSNKKGYLIEKAD